MVVRAQEKNIRRILAEYPACVLLGPRQCGKTTLAKKMGKAYFDLEQPGDVLRLDLEWEKLLSSKKLVVLDEAQAVPEVFNKIRGAIDLKRQQNGKFLLLGSVGPTLVQNISQSLAGRVAFVNLSPLSLLELKAQTNTLYRLWVMGGFPDGGILKPKNFFSWQKNYLQSLVQVDLPAWGLPSRPSTTMKLLKMLTHVHGNIWNATQVSNSLGLTYKTVNHYLDYLEAAFLVRRLMPFYANIKKRLVKSPKVYWRDTGLLHHLLNIQNQSQLLSHPVVGASWEGFVIEQILIHLQHKRIECEVFFFRSHEGLEVDLVLEFDAQTRWAIEVKLTTQVKPEHFHKLNKAAQLIKAGQQVIISQTSKPIRNKNLLSCNLEYFLKFVSTR